jgi:DNA recombination protein RmuC
MVVLALLALLAGLAVGYLVAQARGSVALAGVTASLDAARRDLDAARAEAAAAAARSAADRTALEYERTTGSEMRETFQALAAQVAESNSKQFLEHARDTLAAATATARGDLDQRKAGIEALVAPMASTLAKVEARLREFEVSQEGAREGLLAQIGEMRQTSVALQKETQALVTALRKPQVRGSWGEMHLRRAVELAGMAEHCDFAEQATSSGPDGRVRPDLVVRLAGGRNVVVDAKVPLVAFLDAIEATDEDVRLGHLRTHARHLRTHVESLAAKTYWEHFEPAPEFVVLFVPQDAVLDAALTHDKDLFEWAIARRVLLTTPTSLMGMLLTVAHTWKQEAVAQNAREVYQTGRELYKRLSALGGNVERLGGALNRAVAAYNDTVGSLERRVLPQARRFRDLRVSDATIDELTAIGDDTRLLTAPELVDSAAAERHVTVVTTEPAPELDATLRRAAGLA